MSAIPWLAAAGAAQTHTLSKRDIYMRYADINAFTAARPQPNRGLWAKITRDYTVYVNKQKKDKVTHADAYLHTRRIALRKAGAAAAPVLPPLPPPAAAQPPPPAAAQRVSVELGSFINRVQRLEAEQARMRQREDAMKLRETEMKEREVKVNAIKRQMQQLAAQLQ
jgi:hypothetical protein